MEENFALNDRAAESNPDGSITFRCNCPGQPNNMEVQPRWSQVIRLYQPISAEAISDYVVRITSEVAVEPGGRPPSPVSREADPCHLAETGLFALNPDRAA